MDPLVPLRRNPLRLAADPRSAQTARQWIATQFEQLDRVDVLECAQLGISELVTNALLHGGDPVAVRLRGTREHPRIEVTDGSSSPPVPSGPSDNLEDLLATFGRGLGIVARCSTAWGATIESSGKVVWFEPAPQPQEKTPPAAEFFDPDQASGTVPEPDGTRASIRLLRVPVATTLGLHRQQQDLRREVRLLSFAHEDAYPLAGTLTQAFSRFQSVYPAAIVAAVDAAAAEGDETLDLETEVVADAGSVFGRMLELMDLADEFCRNERLLSLARSPHQRRFQTWLLGELIAQPGGAPPSPWPGRTGTA